MARSGGLDGALAGQGGFYNLDYTPAILFLGDGTYFQNLAAAQHLTGDQWGMMNETGNYPGQSWLWLFSLFYQVEPFASAPNADLLVVLIMGLLTLLLALIPFIPGCARSPSGSRCTGSSGATTTARGRRAGCAGAGRRGARAGAGAGRVSTARKAQSTQSRRDLPRPSVVYQAYGPGFPSARRCVRQREASWVFSRRRSSTAKKQRRSSTPPSLRTSSTCTSQRP